jgi:hypothetical protein
VAANPVMSTATHRGFPDQARYLKTGIKEIIGECKGYLVKTVMIRTGVRLA